MVFQVDLPFLLHEGLQGLLYHNEEEYRAIVADTQTVNFSVYPFSLAMSIPSAQGQFSRARGA